MCKINSLYSLEHIATLVSEPEAGIVLINTTLHTPGGTIHV